MYKLKRLMAVCGVSTFLAVGAAVGGPVTTALASYPSETLFFACEYAGPPAHPDHVYVMGYNQYGNYVGHSFLSYYTWVGNYWWWEVGTTVQYLAWVGNNSPYWESFYVSGRATYDTVLTSEC